MSLNFLIKQGVQMCFNWGSMVFSPSVVPRFQVLYPGLLSRLLICLMFGLLLTDLLVDNALLVLFVLKTNEQVTLLNFLDAST